ncbi:MAG: hypothetical protein JSV21_07200 [Nitrospirota bacterium]|nr:MAG: hypothetical protein JSV21_07200 [Nitrospirota bacterium]
MIKELFVYIAPVLITALCLDLAISRTSIREHGRYIRCAAMLIASMVISLVPVGGLSLSQLILSFNPVFSIGSISLLMAILAGRVTGRRLLEDKDLLLLSTWNICLALFLYLSYLNFIDIDLYYMGYGSAIPVTLTSLFTVVLIIFRSPVSWIFISCIAAYDLRLLPSGNFFDYIVDVPLFAASLVIVSVYIVKSLNPKQAIPQ